ncbi:MAG: SUMF1/EgtB/PvdO family nonheme iron enzyme [Gammaproteobacteria bacterium]|nr:SUMF1/EgtB/PvdO family nonheme iron enzyme [Gammaproteobacteria bacterium]
MAEDHYALPAGYRLDEYEIRRVLGTGALGIKYVAINHDQDRPVVIKEYLPDHLSARTDAGVVPKSPAHQADFDAALGRFLEEGNELIEVSHPNLVQMVRCLEANGTGYIVRDFVEGKTLSGLLERKSTLSEEESAKFLLPILGALDILHRGNFLHRDIGPDKIVIAEDGTPVLLGFPAQQQVTGARQTFRAMPRGSSPTPRPGYAALEQYSQMGHLGPWTDIYGLGAVMYRCATGLRPPEATERAVGDELIPVSQAAQTPYGPGPVLGIDAALSLRLYDRPQSIAAWRQLFDLAADQSVRGIRRAARGRMFMPSPPLDPDRRLPRARPPSPPQLPARKPAGGRRWAVPAIAATALIAVLTWVDTSILRSSGAEHPVPLPSSELLTTASRHDRPREPLRASPEGTDQTPAQGTTSAAAVLPVDGSSSDPARRDLVSADSTPALATLVVATTPPGAEILISDTLIGRTPLSIRDLPAGSYDVTLRHALYETLSETVTVPDPADPERMSTRMERALVHATGALAVRTQPSNAWIEHNGERLADSTPATIRGLPAGPLELMVGAQEHRSERVTANVPKNGVGSLELSLDPSIAYGTLDLVLTPADADASLPDLDLAYEAGMRIPEGSHVVRVTRDGYAPETRTIEVAGITRTPISLAPNPQPFTVATTPGGAIVSLPLSDHDYRPGMLLTPGNYRVRVVLPGHETWEGSVQHDIGPTDHALTLRTGIAEFSDPLASGGTGPAMIAIPAGRFRMGCTSRLNCRPNELPVHTVTLPTTLALSKFEVTCAEFARFARATGKEWESSCSTGPSLPAVNVSWRDAVTYADWLSSETRRSYRLPSESEWEYAARAGTTTSYSWGSSVGVGQANCAGCRSRANRDPSGTVAVGSFPANPWGLHDMHGNAWEWASDCRSDSYEGATGDGSARITADCEQRILRSGSWRVDPSLVRAAQRGWGDESLRLDDVGIRVVVELE